MAVYKNTFEGGTDGAQISVAGSGGASGTAFSQIIVNGAGVTSSPNFIYSSAAAQTGALGCRMTTTANISNLLLSASSTMSDRVYLRLKATYPGPASSSINAIATIMAGNTQVAKINIPTSGRPFLENRGGAWLDTPNGSATDSRPAAALTPGAKYTFIVIVGKSSADGTADGYLGFRIIDAGGQIVHQWEGNVGNNGVADYDSARFGVATNANGWSTLDFDDVEFGDIASGWPDGTNVVVTTGLYFTADFTGSTSGSGNALTYSIAFTSGDNQSSGIKQPVSGLFLIPQGAAASVYTVTVTDGAEVTTQTVNVPAAGSQTATEGVVEYYWDGTAWA